MIEMQRMQWLGYEPNMSDYYDVSQSGRDCAMQCPIKLAPSGLESINMVTYRGALVQPAGHGSITAS